MNRTVRACAALLAGFTLLTGVLYPGLVTVAAGLLFPWQAGGSLVRRDGAIVGSRLIGQTFAGQEWFHGRPSASPGGPYDAYPSGGGNQGPLHPAWRDSVQARVLAARNREGNNVAVPVDLVTASGSGLDPHISPAGAYYQVPRVARARGLPESAVRGLVAGNVRPRTLGLLGEPRVNVLELNLALDTLAAAPGEAAAVTNGRTR